MGKNNEDLVMVAVKTPLMPRAGVAKKIPAAGDAEMSCRVGGMESGVSRPGVNGTSIWRTPRCIR